MDTAAALPGGLGEAVLAAARDGFVDGMHLASGVAALVAVGIAVLAVVTLRHIPNGKQREAEAAAAAEATVPESEEAERELVGAAH